MLSRTSKLNRLKVWISRHRPQFLLIVGSFLILVASGTTAFLLTRPLVKIADSEPIIVKKKPQPKPKYYAPLTGEQVDNQTDTTKPVTAIMIENSPDARPQSGLKSAEVVYEAIAEGGITRFLALYQQAKPQLVGPVRSLRMYYVDWLAPYDASVAHVGGSAAALNEIRNGSYRDIDQFFNASSYWRANDRWAPHNVYTSFEKLDELNKVKNFTKSEPKVFAREDSAKETTETTAQQIKITMSSALYNSSYTYDQETKLYLRAQAGAPHLDREAGQIDPRVVIVIKAAMSLVQEDGWRQSYQTTGSGEAMIFQDGQAIEATWHKDARQQQYWFSDKSNQPIKLARGKTWISVVPSDSGGVSWQ